MDTYFGSVSYLMRKMTAHLLVHPNIKEILVREWLDVKAQLRGETVFDVFARVSEMFHRHNNFANLPNFNLYNSEHLKEPGEKDAPQDENRIINVPKLSVRDFMDKIGRVIFCELPSSIMQLQTEKVDDDTAIMCFQNNGLAYVESKDARDALRNRPFSNGTLGQRIMTLHENNDENACEEVVPANKAAICKFWKGYKCFRAKGCNFAHIGPGGCTDPPTRRKNTQFASGL